MDWMACVGVFPLPRTLWAQPDLQASMLSRRLEPGFSQQSSTRYSPSTAPIRASPIFSPEQAASLLWTSVTFIISLAESLFIRIPSGLGLEEKPQNPY